MSILEQLGVALGLASLAGLNLYLTVLLTGLAVRFDLLQLADKYQSLEVLSHPAILAVAALLFVMEFLADKVPWLDTLWDSVHTFIRPIGGTLLGLQALGDMPTYMEVIAGLIAGGAALTTHGVKAGSRLLVNHSPEPVSNVTLSVTEDAALAGGLVLTLLHPVVGLIVFTGVLLICWLLLPGIWRGTKATLRLAWHKLQMPGRTQPLTEPVILPRRMNDLLKDILLYRGQISDKEVTATVPCLTGKSKGVRGMSPNLSGIMVLTNDGKYLYFMASKGLRDRLFRVPLSESTITTESRFLSENLLIEMPGMKAIFRFPRGEGDIAQTIALQLNETKGKTTPESTEISPVTSGLLSEKSEPEQPSFTPLSEKTEPQQSDFSKPDMEQHEAISELIELPQNNPTLDALPANEAEDKMEEKEVSSHEETNQEPDKKVTPVPAINA